jgi:antitoxin FitA
MERARRSMIGLKRTLRDTKHISKVIQVRGVPDQVHRVLKARAAREGISLSDFIRKELACAAERPTLREWLELTRRAERIPTKRSAAKAVRGLRDAR